MTKAVRPTDWHRQLPSDEVECSICDCPLRYLNGSHVRHRRTLPADKTISPWVRRSFQVGREKLTFLPLKFPSRKHVYTNHRRKLRERIQRATAIVATGKSQEATARLMGITRKTLFDARREDPKLWERELKSARRQLATLGKIVVDRPDDGPPPEIAERIAKATAALAGGARMDHVATELDISVFTLREYRHSYAALWKREMDRALEITRAVVSSQAGTAAIGNDPENFVRAARRCRQTPEPSQQPRSEPSGEMTLSEFFEAYYLPIRLFEGAPATVKSYRAIVHRWDLLMGNPPLKDCTTKLFARFRDAITKLPGLHAPRVSPHTVRSNLRHLQTLFDKAGPRGRRNRDAAGLIPEAPYVIGPRASHTPRTIVSVERFQAVYRAADLMDVPQNPGITPAAWWRALLVVALYTGLRRRTLFSLQQRHVDWEKRRISIPASFLKMHRDFVAPLNKVTVEHLRAIKSDSPLLFPFPNFSLSSDGVPGSFPKHFHRLQFEAGIPYAEHFGLHALRRTLATMLWEVNPGAAQLALGHTTATVTRECYIRPDDIVARAVDALPDVTGASGNGNGRSSQKTTDTPAADQGPEAA